VTDPSAEHDDADLDVSAASDHRPLCPCCGGRMIIVESFGRAAHPAARHRPKPPCHDAHHRLIAPSACRRTRLPALHRCRPAASNRMPYAVDHAEIALSTAAMAPNSPPLSSIRRRLRRPARPQRRPPHRQIPIVPQPVTRPPRVPSWEAFGRRPQRAQIGHHGPASETLHQSRPCPA
jgi:hypothetical protein